MKSFFLQNLLIKKIYVPFSADLLSFIISHTCEPDNYYLIKNKFSKAKQQTIISDTFELLWRMMK